jgi:hypothetical protein
MRLRAQSGRDCCTEFRKRQTYDPHLFLARQIARLSSILAHPPRNQSSGRVLFFGDYRRGVAGSLVNIAHIQNRAWWRSRAHAGTKNSGVPAMMARYGGVGRGQALGHAVLSGGDQSEPGNVLQNVLQGLMLKTRY